MSQPRRLSARPCTKGRAGPAPFAPVLEKPQQHSTLQKRRLRPRSIIYALNESATAVHGTARAKEEDARGLVPLTPAPNNDCHLSSPKAAPRKKPRRAKPGYWTWLQRVGHGGSRRRAARKDARPLYLSPPRRTATGINSTQRQRRAKSRAALKQLPAIVRQLAEVGAEKAALRPPPKNHRGNRTKILVARSSARTPHSSQARWCGRHPMSG